MKYFKNLSGLHFLFSVQNVLKTFSFFYFSILLVRRYISLHKKLTKKNDFIFEMISY